ncbi:MAG: hypothetical protein A2W77_02480 [Nitrospinae bacterium RIFCSPLOWO2_12_39_16]|nr:MAG: hypothetical protein A2Z59_03280 [Nitrospinae bacterium RIFCSPLOWO2_02_39_17]OGW10124.1 MAG: hypothetical protein A2W77_02480 [Nitrospinae bacterium RIFCSPLOWO2_12_39_16]
MEAKKRTTLFVTTWLCVGMILMGGCAHPLVIKNLDSYRAYGVSSFEKPLKIGIATDATEPEQKRLMDGIANALGGYSAQVVMPYQANSQKEVDFIAHVDIQTEHKGSGWNFLINWPGFLIWTPAWNGYVYEVKYTINCRLAKGGTKETIDEFRIPIALDIRHAAINRTWTEISWLEVSAIAFVGGLVFINYDESVTPLVSEKVENPLGKFIAQEIVKRINASGKFSYIYEKDTTHGLAMTRSQLPRPQG